MGGGRPFLEEELPKEKLREIPLPGNQAALLTLQCRRILLLRKDQRVVGYMEAAGDYFPKENAFSEQMTLWDGIRERDAVVGYRQNFISPVGRCGGISPS